MVVRELITSWGFDVNMAPIQEMDKRIGEVRNKTDGFGKNLSALANGVRDTGMRMSAFLTAPIVAAGAAFVNTASDVEELQSKFEAVFKDLSSEAASWATETAKAVGRSRFDLQGYMSTLQDTFVPLGFARDQAAEMSKQMTQLAIDLASFNNASEPETVELLTSALVGNHEAVRRFGIVMTETTLNQELLNMGIAGGTKNATEQQKAMARLNIIVRSSGDAIGDAARTSGGFANRLRAVRARLKDVALDIGNRLLPFAQKLINGIESLANRFDSLSDGTKNLILGFAAFIAIAGPVLFILGSLASAGLSIIKLSAAIKAMGVMMKAVGVNALFMNAAIMLLPILIAAAIAAIVLFIEDIVGWVNGSQSAIGQLLGSFEDFKNKIKEWLGPDLVNAISATFDTVVEIIKAVPGAVVDAAKLAWSVFDRIFVEPVRAALRLFGIGGQDATVTGMVAGGSPAQTVQQSAASNRSNNLTSNISITVPPGTPEEQANAIAAVAEQAIKKAFNEAVDSSASEFPEYE